MEPPQAESILQPRSALFCCSCLFIYNTLKGSPAGKPAITFPGTAILWVHTPIFQVRRDSVTQTHKDISLVRKRARIRWIQTLRTLFFQMIQICLNGQNSFLECCARSRNVRDTQWEKSVNTLHISNGKQYRLSKLLVQACVLFTVHVITPNAKKSWPIHPSFHTDMHMLTFAEMAIKV